MFQFLFSKIKKFLLPLLSPFFGSKVIIFESQPDLTDNSYPVYLYIKKHYPQYMCLWDISSEQRKSKICINSDDKGLLQRLRYSYYMQASSAFICCNRMYKSSPRQISLYLCHGSKTKNTRGMYDPGKVVDFINIQSHFFDEFVKYGYMAKQEQLVYLGYPRCDWFYDKFDISDTLKAFNISDEKYIVWLPTLRKHKFNKRRDVHSYKFEQMGIPLIYNETMLFNLNHFLSDRKYHIIYKPHPVQDLSSLTQAKLSNFHIINDIILAKHNVQLYQLLANSEALITDYSSVYFDYLLLNRPMATTLDDIEEWKSGRGFAFDLEAMYAKTNESLYTLDDLFHFIDIVLIQGKDTRSIARKEVKQLTNLYDDGNSARRVAEFILNIIETKK